MSGAVAEATLIVPSNAGLHRHRICARPDQHRNGIPLDDPALRLNGTQPDLAGLVSGALRFVAGVSAIYKRLRAPLAIADHRIFLPIGLVPRQHRRSLGLVAEPENCDLQDRSTLSRNSPYRI